MAIRRQAPGRVYTRKAPTKANPDRVTFTALFWDGEQERSAGSYNSFDEAETAWLAKASLVRTGMWIHPNLHTMPLADFCEIFLSLRDLDSATNRREYETAIRIHLIPRFGKMTMQEMERAVVEIDDWMNSLKETHAPSSRRTLLGRLSGILTDAVRWGYMAQQPIKNVKKPKEIPNHGRALLRWQFDDLYTAMEGDTAKLFIHLAVTSGCRYGELTELRLKDVSFVDEDWPEEDQLSDPILVLHVRRSVADVGSERSVDGGRFDIQQTTKTMHDRKVILDADSSKMLREHILVNNLSEDDLLFGVDLFNDERNAALALGVKALVIPQGLGLIDGTRYRHGTLSGYGAGKCRCEHCTAAPTLYRRKRRAEGLDLKQRANGTIRGENKSGHMPRDTFRKAFWLPALKAAGLDHFRFHDLRHTHCTWCAKDGMDIVELMTRMGHMRMETTRRYITTNRPPDVATAERLTKMMAKPAKRGHRLAR